MKTGGLAARIDSTDCPDVQVGHRHFISGNC